METTPNSDAIPQVRVVIIGRPNVGKSTLFNRLVGRRKALVHDLPGVTRDVVEARVEWNDGGTITKVLVQDTGGLSDVGVFSKEIEKKIDEVVRRADLVFWVVDGQSGEMPEDRDFSKWLRRRGQKEVTLVVNKIDHSKHEAWVHDFHELGVERVVGVSAEHGRSVEDLRDLIRAYAKIKAESAIPTARKAACSVSIVGRPNVGKSTLLNALVGEDRMIVSPIAGTTIDSVDSYFRQGDQWFRIIDTAGIRRKSKTEKNVEVLSVVKSIQAIEESDVVFLLLDGEKGVVDQDEKIAGLIEKAGRGVVLVVNKWDVFAHANGPRKTAFTREMAAARIRSQMRFLNYAPIVFVSAKLKKNLSELGSLAAEIMKQRETKVTTQELSRWIRAEAEIHNPKHVKFYMSHQTSRHPPTFACHVSDPKKIDFSLKRHLINGIRGRWGFMGNPVRMVFTKSKNATR